MGIKKFKVEFENVNRCFFPGQTVVGHVVIDANSQKKIKGGLWVKFDGRATVSWSASGLQTGNGSDKRKTRKTIYYRDIEPYFNKELILIGQHALGDGRRSEIVIPSGQSRYRFEFTLPFGLPSSYVGKAGQVYYSTEIILGVAKTNLKQKIPFSVNGILDLNHEVTATQGLNLRKYKRVCCWWCRSGPVGFHFQIPKRGFVPGEPIRFVVEISNQSSRQINGITLSLIQYVSFHAKGNTFNDMRTIRKIKGPEVGTQDDGIWDRDALQIPPIAPTRLTNCRIIDVQYVLNLEMEISGFTAKLCGELPIVIGTIPLREAFPYFTPPPPNSMSIPVEVALALAGPSSSQINVTQTQLMSSNMESTISLATVFEEYPDLPPPTYEEAMSNEIDSKGITNMAFKSGQTGVSQEDNDGQLEAFDVDRSFNPRYVTYTWAN